MGAFSCRIMWLSAIHGNEVNPYPLHYRAAFAFSTLLFPHIGLPCGSLTSSKAGERYGVTTFRVSDNNGLGLSYPPAVIVSVQPHLDRELTDCTPFGSSLQPCSWSVAFNIIRLVLRNDVCQTFTLVDHTIKSRPRQNDVICLNLHSRFGLFLSKRVLCQSSFAQRDYSQCTYSQTAANGIAGAINSCHAIVTQSLTRFLRVTRRAQNIR